MTESAATVAVAQPRPNIFAVPGESRGPAKSGSQPAHATTAFEVPGGDHKATARAHRPRPPAREAVPALADRVLAAVLRTRRVGALAAVIAAAVAALVLPGFGSERDARQPAVSEKRPPGVETTVPSSPKPRASRAISTRRPAQPTAHAAASIARRGGRQSDQTPACASAALLSATPPRCSPTPPPSNRVARASCPRSRLHRHALPPPNAPLAPAPPRAGVGPAPVPAGAPPEFM